MLFVRHKKIVALFFLIIFSMQLLWPTVSYALTTGPSQPEMQKFEAAGVSELVDLFTGDMKYNIPLLDVGGYPVNLSYQSGTGIEDEASWVSMGWTLNPGALTRQMRGLPDDFDGKAASRDIITKDYDRKEFRKVGGNFVVKPSIFGWEVGKAAIKLGVYKDNYYGIGANFGASLSHNFGEQSGNSLIAGLGLDLSSDVRDGLDISPSFSLSQSADALEAGQSATGFSIGPNYNTRSGLKSVSLEVFSTIRSAKDGRVKNISGSATSYAAQSYTPSITANTTNFGFTFSADVGPTVLGAYLGLGGEGYYYKESISEPTQQVPAYGFMNYLKGRKDKFALLDFNREKDGVFIPSAPAIPVPVATHDLFMATGQAGSMQFRPYFGGNYVVFDRKHGNVSSNASLGVTIGSIHNFKAGGRMHINASKSETGKWTDNNNYLNSAEPAFETGLSQEEPVSFKQSGELTVNNGTYIDELGGFSAAKAVLKPGMSTDRDMRNRAGTFQLPSEGLKKHVRDKKVNLFSYLNNHQAKTQGLNSAGQTLLQGTDSYRKAHHMSEITVTDGAGQRMVYGIPVYNTYQEEVTFSVQKPSGFAEQVAKRAGLVSYTVDPGNNERPLYKYGRDELYSRERMPGYATGYLLTGVLSPDYVDLTDDGITDDDLGTAVKFSYERHKKDYKWRAPYQENMANYNEGLLSDPKDDKASYVYGEKELWYLSTIESKTMIAVFHTSEREDAFGVLGRHGGLNSLSSQKKLDRIDLYSKADYAKNGLDAVPIKTVHFDYDYSLYPGSPNSTASTKGRLTLKKVYFTFGRNNRGMSNPYEFTYQVQPLNDGNITNLPQPNPPTGNSNDPLLLERNEVYTERQADRWGTYKQSWYNRLIGSGNTSSIMNNSEYPYSLQKLMPPAGVDPDAWSAFIDRMAAQWQLSQIITPSGGVINVEYESDDYAYVQDRRAMNMYFIKGIENDNQPTGLINANRIAVNLPVAVASYQEFKELYLRQHDGTYLDKLYYKFYTDMDNISSNTKAKHWEYVYGYAQIAESGSTASGNTAYITLKKRDGYNPIAKGAWQMLRTDLPQYAYDGYDNTDVGSDVIAAIKSIFHAVKNIGTELRSFDKRAANRGYANQVDLTKSMVRLYVPRKTTAGEVMPVNRKTGGGLRVKKVQINDQWSEMTDEAAGESVSYGQIYDYAIRDEDGRYLMSSGVAAYEPMIGGEENPFREPVHFTEPVHWQRDRYHYTERPFCESYFPGPSVGYSQVTITPFGADFNGTGTPVKHTGDVVNEFYTARDFPTLVEDLTLDKREYENSLILRLFTSRSTRKTATSQGFSVVLNDMHGKPKSVRYRNKAGDLVNSTEYFYNVQDQQSQRKELKSEVPLLGADGTITQGVLGEEVDFVTDVRESVNSSVGVSTGKYLGATWIGIFGIGYASYIPAPTSSLTKYNSISAVKVIHRTGIVTRVVTTQNGSTLEAENLLWDAITGQVVLTRNQTEFDQSTYLLSYPAHMVEEYRGMGAASDFIGRLFPGITTNSSGIITSFNALTQRNYLNAGDELIHATDGEAPRGWIIKGPNAVSNNDDFRLIDQHGDFIETEGPWLLVRSGRRNMMTASVGSVVLMKDPRVGDYLQVDVGKHILDAGAITYKEEWPVPVNREWGINPDQCENLGISCFRTFLILSLSTTLANGGTSNIRRGFFSIASDNKTVANMHEKMTLYGCESFALNQWQASAPYYWEDELVTGPQSGGGIDYLVSPGDLINMGDYQISITAVDPEFISLANSELSDIAVESELEQWIYDRFKYCLYKTGPCSYVFRKIVSCSDGDPHPWIATCDPSPYCTYKDLLSFTVNHSGNPHMTCIDPEGKKINPYHKGILGNWRPLQNYVFTTSRNQAPGIQTQPGGTDIRNNGYYNLYTPFWAWQAGSLMTQVDPTATYAASDLRSRWVWNNRSVYYDQKGNEIESADALNRYGAAVFGYQQSVTTAVAGNSRYNEIAFDGFEDYDFELPLTDPLFCPPLRHFDMGFHKQVNTWTNTGGFITTTESHTGKYSYCLTGTASFVRPAGAASPSATPVLDYDGQGRYILNNNDLAKGFAPVEGKKYVFSCWVNDGSPTTNTLSGMTIMVNGQSASGTVPVVEGWKKVEILFDGAADFTLEMSGTMKYVDDIRIHPFDGQMASYVYDENNLRLMAQLDENNFATLYEYDDEGTPVRVKKETERGIMTISESRQSLRKRN